MQLGLNNSDSGTLKQMLQLSTLTLNTWIINFKHSRTYKFAFRFPTNIILCKRSVCVTFNFVPHSQNPSYMIGQYFSLCETGLCISGNELTTCTDDLIAQNFDRLLSETLW